MTIATARPNGDAVVQNFNKATGSAYYAQIDGSATSGEWIQPSTGYPSAISWYVANLNAESVVSLGTTKRVRAIRIWAEVQNVSDVGHQVKASFTLRELETVRNITTRDFIGDYSAGSINAKQYGAWHATNPDGQPWNQGNIQRLQVEVYGYRSTGGQFLRIHTIGVEIDVKDPPTTSAVTLADTNTTRPQITATYAAVEGDPLARAEYKVFTAAQVAAAGFNPSTSAAVWSSGEVSVAGLNTHVDIDLAPGTTYHAYVRSAYLLNGSPFWSSWASQSFTITVEPPPTPVLSVSADATLRRALLALSAQINALTYADADFEDATPGNYIAGSGITGMLASTTFARHGIYSLRVTYSGSAAPFFANTGGSGAGLIPVSQGEQWTIGGYARAGTTGRTHRLVIRRMQGADRATATFHSQVNGTTAADVTGAWTAIPAVTDTIPSGVTFIAIQMEATATPAAGEQHYYDQLQAVPGASLPASWAPGYLSSAVLGIEAWDRARGVLVNLASRELAASKAGFSRRTAADALGEDATQSAISGSSQRWSPSATGSILDMGFSGAGGAFAESYALPASAGLVAVASFYAKASAPGNYTGTIGAADPVGTAVGADVGSTTVALTTGWQRFTVAATLPGGAVAHARVSLANATGATGQSVWIDGFAWQLRPAGSSTVADPWVPGSGTVPDWRPVRGGWGVIPSTSQTMIVADYEVPPGVERVYRARIYVAVPGASAQAVLASADTAGSTGSVFLAPDGQWRVKDPYQPHRNAVVRAYGQVAEQLDPAVSVFQPAGADLPVAFTDFVGGVNGQLGLLAIGEVEWARMLPLLTAGTTILLDLPEGGHRYLAITGASWPRAGPLGQIQRSVTLAVVEVDVPPDTAAPTAIAASTGAATPETFGRANTFEGGTDGVAITVVNSGGTSGDPFDSVYAVGSGSVAPVFRATSPLKGTRMARASAGISGMSSTAWSWPAGELRSYSRCYYRVPATLPGGDLYIMQSTGVGSGNAAQVKLTSAGKIVASNAADAVLGTSALTLATSQDFRIELAHFANGASGTIEVRIFTGAQLNSSTPSEILGPFTTDASTVITEIRAGLSFAAVAATMDYDDFRVSSATWPGPS